MELRAKSNFGQELTAKNRDFRLYGENSEGLKNSRQTLLAEIKRNIRDQKEAKKF